MAFGIVFYDIIKNKLSKLRTFCFLMVRNGCKKCLEKKAPKNQTTTTTKQTYHT